MTIWLTIALALFNMTGARAARVLAVLYALQLDASPLTIGALAAAFALFPMLLSWPAGRISDRYGPRWPLTLGALFSAAGMLLPSLVPTLPMVFVAAAMIGVGSTFYSVSLQNMVGAASSAENRARNYSNYAMSISAANSIGPLIAGFGLDHAGHSQAFMYVALCFMLPVGILAAWGGRLPQGKRSTAPPLKLRDTLTHPRIWPILAASSLAQSGLDIFQVYIPVYCSAHGMSASAIGIVIAMCAVGGFSARIILPTLMDRFNGERVFAYALVLGGLTLALVPFVSTVAALSAIAFFFGCGLNVSQPISLTIMYARSPEGRSGEALGVRFALDNATRLVSPIIFGMLAGVAGIAWLFWVNGAMVAGGSTFVRPSPNKTGRPL